MHGLQSLMYLLNMCVWTPLVAQWIRINLPRQGTWAEYLVQEDSTCHRATKPVCHNYWALVWQLLEPVLCNKRSQAVRNLCTTTREPPLLQLGKAWAHSSEHPAQPKKDISKYVLVEGKAVSDNLGTVGPLQEKMREGGQSQEWQWAERCGWNLPEAWGKCKMGELTEREKSRQRLLTPDLLFLCKIKQIFKMLVTFSSHSSSSGLPLYTAPSYQVTYSEYKLNALNQPLKGVFLYLGRERPSILIGNRPSIKRALNTSKTEKTQDWWSKDLGSSPASTTC